MNNHEKKGSRMTNYHVARKMREDGCTYREIADHLGKSISTVYRWLNLEYNEQCKVTARRWKTQNKRHCRLYDHHYNAFHSGTCMVCSGRMGVGVKHDGICMKCRGNMATYRRRLIVERWAQGASLREIAAELGWTISHLSCEMNRIRKQNATLLPLRNRPRTENKSENYS